MKVIGITGGVGSGKSMVLDILYELTDCIILRADDVAKTTILPSGPAYKPIVALLGDDILQVDGSINKEKMSAKIFNDRNLCEKVDSIIHPITKDLILDAINVARQDGKKIAFVEAALLIESGFTQICDEVWYIYTPIKERIERLMNSRGYTYDKCMSIINNQLREEEFRENSDRVIDNSGDYDFVKKQLISIVNAL